MTTRRTAGIAAAILVAACAACSGGGDAGDASDVGDDSGCDLEACIAHCREVSTGGGPPYGYCGTEDNCICTHTDPGPDDAGGREDAAEPDDAEAPDEAAEPDDADDGSEDGGGTPPSLTLAYADPCPCYPPPCCPAISLTFSPGSEAAWYLMCGDAVACDTPPVGWEQQGTDGTWTRIISPGESATAGFQCAPGTWSDLGMYSVPEPPAGTVRAVGLFDAECGADPATCTTRCGAPFEVVSNAVVIP